MYINIKNRIVLSLVFITLVSSLGACKKFLEADPAKNTIPADEAFATDQTATAAIDGIYTTMMIASDRTRFANGAIGITTGLCADELSDFTQTMQDYEHNEIEHTGAGNADYIVWSEIYGIIYQANAAIEGIQKSTGLSASVKQQLLGEAYFIRAFDFFYLTNIYGAVPLALSSDYAKNAVLPRAPVGDVYKQVLADLQQSNSLLTADYPSAGKVRPNKYVAAALLARFYLYQQSYAQADSTVSEILKGPYALETDVTQVFLNTSKETIWQLLPVSTYNYNSYDYGFYTPSTATSSPKFVLKAGLLNSFEKDASNADIDLRKANWIKSYSYSGTTYYYASKYKAAPSAAPTEDNVVLRLAEQYLIGAEAKAQLNDIPGAQTYLNLVRTRAGLPNTTAASKADLLTAIAQERRVEFFTEWGHRWFDLLRTNTADAVLGAAKGADWKSYSKLWPVPYNEIQANPFLVQTPGYK